MSAFYRFALGLVRIAMPLWYRIRVEGKENLPKEGGYLFVSNHRSNADPVLVGMQSKKQFRFLAKQELFTHGAAGWLLRKLGAIAIDRGTGDLSPLEELAQRLKDGDNALIFPEGTRSKDGTLLRFKTGAALLAAQTGVPVVPVGISFKGKLHFRSRITVSFGAPFQIPQMDPDHISAPALKQIRQTMYQNVAALLPPPDDRTDEASGQKGEQES